MRLFITGGTGFLGRRVVAAAAAAGHEALVLTRKPSPSDASEDGDADPSATAPPDSATIRHVQGDVNNTAALPPLLSEYAPEAVIHAAAIVSDTDPHLHRVNVTGTANVVSALRRLSPRPRLVYVSSFAVEDIPPTPYSESKLEAEGLVRTSGVPFVIIRPTLIYGPGDDNNTGPLVAKLQAGKMWLPDGGSTHIQPGHVDDVAGAIVQAAVRSGLEGNTYRLGGPEPVSVAAYRRAVRDATGGSAELRAIPLPLFRAAATLAALVGVRKLQSVLQFHLAEHAVDISAAQADLDYAPRPLDQGLAATFGADGAGRRAVPEGADRV